MPTPDRTSLAEIVMAATEILEAEGPDALTMQAVAHRVGVRAPSLYKRVRSRGHLLGLVVESTLQGMSAQMDAAAASHAADPRAALTALASTLRRFAHAHPAAYRLVFSPLPEAARPSADALLHSSAAVLAVAGALAGERNALPAARTITAWANGFIGMELSGGFQLGGDVDVAFSFGVDALGRALAS